MNAEQLLYAIGLAEDQYVVEADTGLKEKKKVLWVRWIALVACLLLLCSLAFAQEYRGKYEARKTDEQTTEYAINTPYEYPILPGSSKWESFRSGQERINACQIPLEIAEAMSTEALVESILDYPIQGYLIPYFSFSYGEMKYRFYALRVLEEREDAAQCLLKAYKETEVLPIDEYQAKYDAYLASEGPDNYKDHDLIETLLAQPEIYDTLSEEELIAVQDAVLDVYDQRGGELYYPDVPLFFQILEKNGDDTYEKAAGKPSFERKEKMEISILITIIVITFLILLAAGVGVLLYRFAKKKKFTLKKQWLTVGIPVGFILLTAFNLWWYGAFTDIGKTEISYNPYEDEYPRNYGFYEDLFNQATTESLLRNYSLFNTAGSSSYYPFYDTDVKHVYEYLTEKQEFENYSVTDTCDPRIPFLEELSTRNNIGTALIEIYRETPPAIIRDGEVIFNRTNLSIVEILMLQPENQAHIPVWDLLSFRKLADDKQEEKFAYVAKELEKFDYPTRENWADMEVEDGFWTNLNIKNYLGNCYENYLYTDCYNDEGWDYKKLEERAEKYKELLPEAYRDLEETDS